MKNNERENKTILGSPEMAMKMLGCGRNRMYEDLLKRPDFPSFRLGNKHVIYLNLLEDWAEKQCYKR